MNTPRTLPDNIAQIMESVDVECALCRNEGADDIAGLLQEVYSAMSFLVGKVEDLQRELAAREAELAQLKAKIAERNKSDPVQRLHNLCDALGADAKDSPYSEEAWQLQEQAYREKCEELAQWKDTLINELIIDHIYTKEHDTDPRKALTDAIEWNRKVALDPTVSVDAQRLRDTYKAERDDARERYIVDLHDTMDKAATIVGSKPRDADDLLAKLAAAKAELKLAYEVAEMERKANKASREELARVREGFESLTSLTAQLELDRDSWRAKAEANERDAERWKVCLDAAGVSVSIFNCDPASWRYPEGEQLIAAIDAIRTGAENSWQVPIYTGPAHDESPPIDAAIGRKPE